MNNCAVDWSRVEAVSPCRLSRSIAACPGPPAAGTPAPWPGCPGSPARTLQSLQAQHGTHRPHPVSAAEPLRLVLLELGAAEAPAEQVVPALQQTRSLQTAVRGWRRTWNLWLGWASSPPQFWFCFFGLRRPPAGRLCRACRARCRPARPACPP